MSRSSQKPMLTSGDLMHFCRLGLLVVLNSYLVYIKDTFASFLDHLESVQGHWRHCDVTSPAGRRCSYAGGVT